MNATANRQRKIDRRDRIQALLGSIVATRDWGASIVPTPWALAMQGEPEGEAVAWNRQIMPDPAGRRPTTFLRMVRRRWFSSVYKAVVVAKLIKVL
jgi:hypothetical protein